MNTALPSDRRLSNEVDIEISCEKRPGEEHEACCPYRRRAAEVWEKLLAGDRLNDKEEKRAKKYREGRVRIMRNPH